MSAPLGLGYAFDVAQCALVEVTNADVGTVGEQSAPMRDLIRRAPGNQAVGFSADTPCVEVRYVTTDKSTTRTYTIPVTRLSQDRALIAAMRDASAAAGIDI